MTVGITTRLTQVRQVLLPQELPPRASALVSRKQASEAASRLGRWPRVPFLDTSWQRSVDRQLGFSVLFHGRIENTLTGPAFVKHSSIHTSASYCPSLQARSNARDCGESNDHPRHQTSVEEGNCTVTLPRLDYEDGPALSRLAKNITGDHNKYARPLSGRPQFENAYALSNNCFLPNDQRSVSSENTEAARLCYALRASAGLFCVPLGRGGRSSVVRRPLYFFGTTVGKGASRE